MSSTGAASRRAWSAPRFAPPGSGSRAERGVASALPAPREIAALNVAAARAGWLDFLSAEVLERFDHPTERWRTRIEEGGAGSAVLMAVDSGRIVGFVSLRAAGPGPAGAGDIGALYTDPAVWSRGVGRFLLDAALAELRAAGCAEAVLWTEERNARARRVYERYGWRSDGVARERVFLGLPIREIAYRLSLEPSRDERRAGEGAS